MYNRKFVGCLFRFRSRDVASVQRLRQLDFVRRLSVFVITRNNNNNYYYYYYYYYSVLLLLQLCSYPARNVRPMELGVGY